MNSWLLIAGMALLTFLPRYLPLGLAGKVALPAWLQRALEFVPIAVLTAIVAQTALVPQGVVDLSWHNHRWMAALSAGLAAYLSRNLFVTVLVGLASFALMGLLR